MSKPIITKDQNTLVFEGNTYVFEEQNFDEKHNYKSPCEKCHLDGQFICNKVPCDGDDRFDLKEGFYIKNNDPLRVLRAGVYTTKENEQMVGAMLLKQQRP